MDTWLAKFKEKSLKKFESMQSESSEIFRKQTAFKEFDNFLEIKNVSHDTGVEIVEKPDLVDIKPIANVNLEEIIRDLGIEDKFVEMNNAFFNSGIVITVNDEIDGILRIKSKDTGDVVSKIIVLMGDDSKLDIVKESYSSNNDQRFVSEDVFVIANSGANLKFSELQNYNQSSLFMSNKIVVCKRDSKVVWNIGMFGGAKSRSRTYNIMEGDGSSVEDLQLFFGDNVQEFDAFSNLIHVGRSTIGRTISKGAFKDKSNSIFKGMIKIKENAKNASSYLACHGMLLSKNAKANTIPSLEIGTNDVKATHSASVSPIDEEKIFYLKARAINEEDARKIITLGFFDPLIRSIDSEEIRAKIRWLIESKWKGEDTRTFDKDRLKEFVEEDAIKRGDIFEGHYKYR